MNMKMVGTLSEKEEKLLVKFLDSECSMVERMLVRRLLQRDSRAAEFLNSMRAMSDEVGRVCAGVPADSADLWARVSARIDSERRSEVFLGPRHKESRFRGLQELLSMRSLGLAGAVSAAAVLLIVVQFTGQPGAAGRPVGVVKSSSGQSGAVVPVNVTNRGGSDESVPFSRPQLLEKSYPSTMEVDWVRSHGRVRLIQDPDEKSTIIWIKRRKPIGQRSSVPSSGLSSAQRFLKPFPSAIPVSSR